MGCCVGRARKRRVATPVDPIGTSQVSRSIRTRVPYRLRMKGGCFQRVSAARTTGPDIDRQAVKALPFALHQQSECDDPSDRPYCRKYHPVHEPRVVRLGGVVQRAALGELSRVAVLRQRHRDWAQQSGGRQLHRSNASQRRDAREYATLGGADIDHGADRHGGRQHRVPRRCANDRLDFWQVKHEETYRARYLDAGGR